MNGLDGSSLMQTFNQALALTYSSEDKGLQTAVRYESKVQGGAWQQ